MANTAQLASFELDAWARPASSVRALVARPGYWLTTVVLAALVGTVAGAAVSWQLATRERAAPMAAAEPPLDGTVQNVPQLVATTSRSVVRVTVLSSPVVSDGPAPTGQALEVGTGLVVSRDGRILTDAHVVDALGGVLAVIPAGTNEAVPASLVGLDPQHDLALLQVDENVNMPPVTFAPQPPAVGDEVVAVGFALGMGGSPSVSEGIVSGLGRTFSTRAPDGTPLTYSDMVQTDAPISSGDSGGPLLNSAGQVAGIIEGSADASGTNMVDNVGFVTPASELERALPSLNQAAGGSG
jgi:putative serine protease PepD